MAEQSFSVDAWSNSDQAHGPNRPVSLSLPEQVSYWTRATAAAGGGYLYGDTSGVRTLVPNLEALEKFDLNRGYPDAFIRKADSDDAVPVDVILYGAMYAYLPLDRTTIVTFRNNLNKLLMTPLQRNEPWVIDAVFYNNTLFLEIVKLQGKQPLLDHDRFTYYGYKFEAICTDADPDKVVDSTGEFASMFQVRLGQHLILMAAEMDAWEEPSELEQENFAGFTELKTYVLPQGERGSERLYREKYPRWWVQSFLAGVPTLVLGGRDRSGILQKVSRLPVTRLPALARDRGYPFDAFQLLRFGDAALEWMRKAASASPEEHVRFTYDPQRQAITATVLNPDMGFNLPERVVAALTRPMAQEEEQGSDTENQMDVSQLQLGDAAEDIDA
ncbi:hypothetical protein Vretimale_8362 [Volvox reticuliferus]|uniref:Decapping nuclease n=1 Tax=Volvox reticuliferus TaxID=1737510 RepID=A0A8J4GAS8_9CHLO|nr:hypothetical protein Vretifemale_11767 [Volvox reticuliferus]GIM03690.1 hypothetical protein Vretimale_8362 [Volvox reticuliferus]